MQEKKFLYLNKQISYSTVGEGESVLVLVHGFPEDRRIWKNQWDAFPGYTLIIPDLPGSGQSEAIEDMSMEGLATALACLLEAEISNKNQQVTLIGHSMGGYITLAFAEKYPERLNGFGLFHSTSIADNEQKIEARKKGIETIRNKGVKTFVEGMIPNLYAEETKEKRPQLIKEQIEWAYNFSGENLVSYYEAMMKRPDRTNLLKQSKVPVLFIFGKSDTAVRLEEGLQLCHLPEISYIDILEHSAHMGMREEVSKANKLITNFLRITATT